MQGQQDNENKRVKLSITFQGWVLIGLLLLFAAAVIYGQVNLHKIKKDIKALNAYAVSRPQDSILQDSTLRDSTVFVQKAEVERIVNNSTQKAFDIYVATQGNLLAIVAVLISAIVIVIPLIINYNFRTSNEEWYKEKINFAEIKMHGNLERELGDYNQKVKQARKELLVELKKVLGKLKNHSSKSIETLETRLSKQKGEFDNIKKRTDGQAIFVMSQARAIDTLKENFEKFTSNYILEVEFKDSLKEAADMSGKSNKKDIIEYYKKEIKKNKQAYPASGFYELGKLYFETNDYGKAIIEFKEAISRNPYYVEAYQSIAETFLIQVKSVSSMKDKGKKLKDAWSAIETALSIKENVNILESRSRVFLAMGLFEEAKNDAKKCLDLAKKSNDLAKKSNEKKYSDLLNNIIKLQKEEIIDDAIEEIKIKEGVTIKMKKVEGGVFTMGASRKDSWKNSEADLDERPVHRVLLDDYYIGETAVTQEIWESIMDKNPSRCNTGKKYPVEFVSWNEIQDFLKKLNAETENRRPQGTIFCLPTEAQWEFAARGGKKSKNFKYSGSNDVNEVAWFWQNSGDLPIPEKDENWNRDRVMKNKSQTHLVMTKECNELGLFDMSGNVWEWCQDCYGEYSSEPQINPKGAEGINRVVRGGGWFNYARTCRVSFRMKFSPDNQYKNLGFRLALVSENA